MDCTEKEVRKNFSYVPCTSGFVKCARYVTVSLNHYSLWKLHMPHLLFLVHNLCKLYRTLKKRCYQIVPFLNLYLLPFPEGYKSIATTFCLHFVQSFDFSLLLGMEWIFSYSLSEYFHWALLEFYYFIPNVNITRRPFFMDKIRIVFSPDITLHNSLIFCVCEYIYIQLRSYMWL